MRRRVAIGVSIIFALAAVYILAVLFWNEPAYQGRRLSVWLRELQHPSPVVRQQAQVAIRNVGTNAVPLLRELLHARDSSFKTNLVALLSQQSFVKLNIREIL